MNSKNIKVALLSFHNAYNYGAAMQAYALQETINDMGIDVEYINYINEFRKNVYNTPYQIFSALKKGNIIRSIRLLLGSGYIFSRARKFKDFYNKHLKANDKIYRNSNDAKVLNGQYDKFIVGSDQVWNCNNNGGDTAYLLDFVDNTNDKISYASSFGMSDIPSGFVEQYSEALKRIGRVSVREKAGATIIEKYTDRKAHVVLDPVFLPDINVWEKIKSEGTTKKGKYIFFYTNRNSQIRDFWNLGLNKNIYKSHILSSFVGFKDFFDRDTYVRVAMRPADFLNEISFASLIVTASFHCVAFSIIFHKKFVVFLTGNRGKDERIINLLKLCGLSNRIITNDTKIDDIEADINYDDVDNRLKPYLKYSREFLYRAVNSLPDIDICDFSSLETAYFCNDERCSGCMACANLCPVNAINIVRNTEGFLAPVREENKCIDCYKCHEVCQVFSQRPVYDFKQRYFAVKNVDNVRTNSSSGGVFTAISDVVLKNNGVICAASMNDEYYVKHIFAHNYEERNKMRRTLYVQSDLSDTYNRIKFFLLSGKEVLFVGTPCQVAGLYNCVGYDKYSNLYTCDIICHGTPSPGIFMSFIDYLKKKYKGLDDFNFRDKELGWRHGYTVSAVVNGKKVFNTLELQSFIKMFSHNEINRSSCANCAYTNYNRVGDVTIGDFWGIEKRLPDFSDDLGVSLVIANTQKGYDLLSACDNLTKIEVRKESTIQNSLRKNAVASDNRMNAFWVYSNYGYDELSKTYGEVNISGWIKMVLRKFKGIS